MNREPKRPKELRQANSCSGPHLLAQYCLKVALAALELVLGEPNFNSVSFNSLPMVSSESGPREGAGVWLRRQETFH